ncbi:MAG TPA: DEAD/DEAH box helicase [Candidatus Hydrogenedentes bacterium]|nr:DEAD/DEAH box helicase [Candidatus Hydrogenedentota bacterium]HOL76418.1 DEAD/DEAH box helicase [Candidatus Hydrogenedentota bacterium]HPO85456.1 DEAD/DEAH box helicase [Candidatus Hydrogenedentota bacterium]
MNMYELVPFGIPQEIIEIWTRTESNHLLPLQEAAVRKGGLFSAKNILIQAPTTSGKTFIGEMAAIQTAMRRKKAVYLVPLKALAEEKWDDFRTKYASYGIRVIVSTRDHREWDVDFEAGKFDIAVAVYEKFAHLLARRPEHQEEIELVVADELEILSDVERGAGVEILLTQLIKSGTRVIGLSAVIGNATELARWMDAELVCLEQRPVELRYGVLHAGRFRYRTYGSSVEGWEEFIDCPGASRWEVVMENLKVLVERGEPCVVFVRDRAESRRGAELLAQRVQLPAASRAVETLRQLETTHSRDALVDLLTRGVAFHNADLSREERRTVEESFRNGELFVIVSTSTLAAGMNLPAQNVFIASEKWRYDSRFGMPWRTPILRAEFENMGGRAGRYGTSNAFGRAILVAESPFDAETLWRRYVEGTREEVQPRVGQTPIDDHIIRLVAAGVSRSEEELAAFLGGTLTGEWIWLRTLSAEEVRIRARNALGRAADNGMLERCSAEGTWEATPLGMAAASKGIRVQTARELADWVRNSVAREWSAIDLMLATAQTPDGRMLQTPLSAQEYYHGDYLGRLKQATQQEPLVGDVPLNQFRNSNAQPLYDEVRSIKTVLFLQDWIEETPVFDIETRHHVLLGQLIAAAEQVSWLIDATAAIALALAAPARFIHRLNRLSERVRLGVREESLELAQLNSPRLSRSAVIALSSRGLHHAEALASLSTEYLSEWMNEDDARALLAWARTKSPVSNECTNSASPTPSKPDATHPLLLVDDHRPDRILLYGKAVSLQEKQFRLIRVLAASPGKCVPYDIIYREVWGDAVVEPNQMHFQKRRLIERIQQVAPEQALCIKTVPKRGFMLDLPPDSVQVVTRDVSHNAA